MVGEPGIYLLTTKSLFYLGIVYKGVRKFLLENLELQSVISLPIGTILPYTNAQTFLLYFTDANKTNSQKEHWYFDVNNDGYSLDNHRKKLKGKNDLHFLQFLNQT